MKTPRIKMNIWGNWNAYQGNSKVAEFGTRESEAREWLVKQQAQSAVMILATYHDRDSIAHKWIPDGEAIHLPATVTPKSYVIRYGGNVTDMQAGKGNVRKILRRFSWGEPVTNWRQYFGTIERGTWSLIKFELLQPVANTCEYAVPRLDAPVFKLFPR